MAPDTRILCEIQSDLTAADERRFVEKNKRFWSLGKHYLKVEYQVKVLIGPADIKFELWFDNQKLSRDQSIKVDWLPAPGPDFPIRDRAELPAKAPTWGWQQGEQKPQEPGNGHTGLEKKKGLGLMPSGLVSMARSGIKSVQG